ncbi:MAG: aspartate--tRNA ligase, partial [Actinomycetia bacterium]|nr:aspartate--tRNA ligase [Actinomycetes bacterium]
LSYREAMDRYGSDKPDLRFGLELVDLSEAAVASEFKAFRSVLDAGGSVRGIRVPGGARFSRREIEELEASAKTYRAKGLAWMKCDEGGLTGGVSKFFGGAAGEALVAATGLVAGDLLVMVGDQGEVTCTALGAVRVALGSKLDLIEAGEFHFLWVHRFPLFERSEEGGEWQAMHHLFTMPDDEDIEHLDSDPGRVRGQLYDLVCNGVELASG